jgi:hypothetical protein
VLLKAADAVTNETARLMGEAAPEAAASFSQFPALQTRGLARPC